MENDPPTTDGLPVRAVGLPWFRREDFARIKTIMEDGQRLHRTWEEWHAAVQVTEQRVKAQGHITHRALLLPDAFSTWCKQRGVALNAQSRMDFAAQAAYEAHNKTH